LQSFDIVRRLVGYASFSTPETLGTLNASYHVHGLLLNCFYPSQKLIEKIGVGSKVKKRYDLAQSPSRDKSRRGPFMTTQGMQTRVAVAIKQDRLSPGDGGGKSTRKEGQRCVPKRVVV
jgi:hypothetical protein